MFELFLIGCFLNSIFCFVFSIFLYSRGKENRPIKIWALFSLSVALWSFGLGMTTSAHSYKIATFWLETTQNVGLILIPVFFLHFVVSIIDTSKNKSSRFFIFVGYLFAIFMLVLNFNHKLAIPYHKFSFNYYAAPGTYYDLFVTIFLFQILYAFYLLYSEYLDLFGVKRNQFKYLLFGMSIGFLGISTTFLPVYGINILPLGIYFSALHVAVVAYAIARFRLMEIKVAVTKASLFLLLYCLILFVPFYIGYMTGSWINSTIIAVILATLGPVIYRNVERRAEDLLLAEQKYYQKFLLRVANVMIKERSLIKLLKLIVTVIKWSISVRYVVFYLSDNDKQTYNLRVKRESLIIPWPEIIAFDNPLAGFIASNDGAMLYEEIPSKVRDVLGIHYRVIIPIPSLSENNKPLGFIILGDKMNRKHYSVDDMNVFNVISKQAALAIENCIFIEEFKNAQEKIFTAEKLASIGGMAQGLVHQINNRLTHLFISLEEIRFQIDDIFKSCSESMQQNEPLKNKIDIINTLSNNLVVNARRIDGIVKGLLGYAKIEAKETFFSTFSLLEVVNICVELMMIKYEIQDFPLAVTIENTDEIYGVKAQLTETIFNVIDNAYEAALERKDSIMNFDEQKSFKPSISLRMKQNEDTNIIEISDNGIGIREEDKNKMFVPFFTTKNSLKSGTGVGMYVVKRIVEENHNGKVHFNSVYNKGTTIIIELPKTIHFNVM